MRGMLRQITRHDKMSSKTFGVVTAEIFEQGDLSTILKDEEEERQDQDYKELRVLRASSHQFQGCCEDRHLDNIEHRPEHPDLVPDEIF